MIEKLAGSLQSGSRRNHPADMIRRLVTPTLLFGLGVALGSCGSYAGVVADHWPHWAGGMPNDAPPRPGAPGYEEFIAHRPDKTDTTTTTSPAATGKTDASPAASSGNRPPTDQAVVQGGLY